MWRFQDKYSITIKAQYNPPTMSMTTIQSLQSGYRLKVNSDSVEIQNPWGETIYQTKTEESVPWANYTLCKHFCMRSTQPATVKDLFGNILYVNSGFKKATPKNPPVKTERFGGFILSWY